MGLGRATLVEVTVGDDPQGWSAIGFAVGDGGACPVGGVNIRLVGAGDRRGVLGWTLAGDAVGTGIGDADDVDGLPTTVATTAAPRTATEPAAARRAATTDPPSGRHAHPNGTTALDHLVVVTPDLDRTTAALAALGADPRRTREAGRGRLQRFFRLGAVILELVGPATPAGDGPASFWGLAFTVADIDATAAHLGDRAGPPRPAVQPGRRITTLRKDDATGGVSVPVAFMSPVDLARPGGAPGQRL
ncbi:MAG TPA: VOC family protein [Acidimicrobiales bacterium]